MSTGLKITIITLIVIILGALAYFYYQKTNTKSANSPAINPKYANVPAIELKSFQEWANMVKGENLKVNGIMDADTSAALDKYYNEYS